MGGRIHGIHHLEISHHTGSMVFDNVAMIHPGSGAVIGHPGDLDGSSGSEVVNVFPGPERWSFSVYFNYLEEKAVQMEGVIPKAHIGNFPNLKLSHHHRLDLDMHSTV